MQFFKTNQEKTKFSIDFICLDNIEKKCCVYAQNKEEAVYSVLENPLLKAKSIIKIEETDCVGCKP